jgi:hypothetical protein
VSVAVERYDVRRDGRSLLSRPLGRLGALAVVERELARVDEQSAFANLVVVEAETYECRACWWRTAGGVRHEAVPGWL